MKKFYVSHNDNDFTVEIIDEGSARINGKECSYEFRNAGKSSYLLVLNNKVFSLFDNGPYPEGTTGVRELSLNSRRYSVTVDDDRSLLLKTLVRSQSVAKGETHVRAPMPGLVVRLEVVEGEHVKKGQGLIVLEAMKMENEIKSPQDGVVRKIHVKEKMAVEKGEDLLLLQGN